MKVTEILIEAIEPKREHFHDILVANKEQLQKSRTRLGVIRNLQRMFPGVKFKLTGNRNTVAQYDHRKNEITINNNDKLMTGSNVRNNWDKFVKDMTDLMTHETIHQQQGERRDHFIPDVKEVTASKSQQKAFQQRWMELNTLLDDYEKYGDKDKAEEVRTQIKKLVAKARRRGVKLQTSLQDYLSDRDEVTAYAEMIANDLVQKYRGEGLDKAQIQKSAIRELQRSSVEPSSSRLFRNYKTSFKKNDKTIQQLIKQVVRYIEMKTQ